MNVTKIGRTDRRGGFTLVEMVIGIAILTVVVYVLAATFSTATKSSATSRAGMSNTETLRGALARISTDLRSASRVAEDTNNNVALDDGEDTNGNGRLDADWQVTANSVRFNRMLANGNYAPPVTYVLNGAELERNVMLMSGRVIRTVIARGVTQFAVTENGSNITVQMTRASPNGMTETQSITIAPRN